MIRTQFRKHRAGTGLWTRLLLVGLLATIGGGPLGCSETSDDADAVDAGSEDDTAASTDEDASAGDASDAEPPERDAAAGDGEADEDRPSVDADGTDVEFIDLRVTDITHSGAWVRFDTSIETTCEVIYGLSEDALDQHATDPTMTPDDLYDIEHNVPLEDLVPATEYFFKARAATPEGEEFFSELRSFTTLEDPNAGDDLVNVALSSAGTTISDFSSAFSGSSWAPENAIDGMMGTEWSSQGDGDDAYLVLDLGQERSLTEIGFRSRQMADGSSIVTSFLLTLDGETEIGPFDTPDPDQEYRFPLDDVQTATTVRFDVMTSTGGNTGVKELQLFTTAPAE